MTENLAGFQKVEGHGGFPVIESEPASTTPSGLVPAGAMTAYAAAAAPTGWLLCDGTAVSRTSYAALFAAISTNYGTGDGSTTFNVPDLKGKVPVGLDSAQTEFDALAETGGAKTHALTSGETGAHSHTGPSHSHTGPSHVHPGPSHLHLLVSDSDASTTLTSSNQIGDVRDAGSDYSYGLDSGGTSGSAAKGRSSSAGTGNTDAGGTGATGTDGTGATGSTGSGTAHQNLQPYVTVNWIIKF